MKHRKQMDHLQAKRAEMALSKSMFMEKSSKTKEKRRKEE